MIIQISKDTAKRIKWVWKGRSKTKDRPILNYMYVEEGENEYHNAVTTNGFSLHFAEVVQDIPVGLWKVKKITSKEVILIPAEVDGQNHLSNWRVAIPEERYKEAVTDIEYNSTLLSSAASMPTNKINMTYHGKDNPTKITAMEEPLEMFALIMPEKIS